MDAHLQSAACPWCLRLTRENGWIRRSCHLCQNGLLKRKQERGVGDCLMCQQSLVRQLWSRSAAGQPSTCSLSASWYSKRFHFFHFFYLTTIHTCNQDDYYHMHAFTQSHITFSIIFRFFHTATKAFMKLRHIIPLRCIKWLFLVLFSAGAELVICCCLRSCLGLAVTRGNGFKMDSLPPCFKSMGLSEDREQQEKEKRSVLHTHPLTHSNTQLWSICSGHLHRATQWPFPGVWGSEIACCVISLVHIKGEKGLPEYICERQRCPDAQDHAHRGLVYISALVWRQRDINKW